MADPRATFGIIHTSARPEVERAAWVRQELERRDQTVLDDELGHIRIGDSPVEVLNRAYSQVSMLLVLLSPDTVRDVGELAAQGAHLPGKTRVIPVFIEPCQPGFFLNAIVSCSLYGKDLAADQELMDYLVKLARGERAPSPRNVIRPDR